MKTSSAHHRVRAEGEGEKNESSELTGGSGRSEGESDCVIARKEAEVGQVSGCTRRRGGSTTRPGEEHMHT